MRSSLQKHLCSINCENQEDHLRRMYQMSVISFLKPSAKTSSATNLRRTRRPKDTSSQGNTNSLPRSPGSQQSFCCACCGTRQIQHFWHTVTLCLPLWGERKRGPNNHHKLSQILSHCLHACLYLPPTHFSLSFLRLRTYSNWIFAITLWCSHSKKPSCPEEPGVPLEWGTVQLGFSEGAGGTMSCCYWL